MDTPAPGVSEGALRAAARLQWLHSELGDALEEDACLLAVGWMAHADGHHAQLANATVNWDASAMTTRVLRIDGVAVDERGTLGQQHIAGRILRNWGIAFQVCSMELDLLREPKDWDQLPERTHVMARALCERLRAQDALERLDESTGDATSQAHAKRL